MPKIFIDPGHGGHDPGAVGNGMRESDINLDVSLRLKKILEDAGLQVRMSRTTDISPRERQQHANRYKNVDMLLSIHTNAGGGTGVETIIPTASPNNPRRDLQQNRRLAENISNALGQRFGLPIRRQKGVMLETETRHGSLGVLRNAKMLAVMVELAFIDSPLHNPDVEVLRNRRQEIAETLADVILEWFGVDNMTDEKFAEYIAKWQQNQGTQPVNPRLAPDEFQAAVNANITDGTRPQALATRQEAAVMIQRATQK